MSNRSPLWTMMKSAASNNFHNSRTTPRSSSLLVWYASVKSGSATTLVSVSPGHFQANDKMNHSALVLMTLVCQLRQKNPRLGLVSMSSSSTLAGRIADTHSRRVPSRLSQSQQHGQLIGPQCL